MNIKMLRIKLPNKPLDPNDYLTTQEVDDQYKALNQRTLELWRSKSATEGKLYGPEWEQISQRKVMYIRSKIADYLASCSVTALNAPKLEERLNQLKEHIPQQPQSDVTILKYSKRRKEK